MAKTPSKINRKEKNKRGANPRSFIVQRIKSKTTGKVCKEVIHYL